MIFKGNFDRVTFALKLARKDLGLATELARENERSDAARGDGGAGHASSHRAWPGRQGFDCGA